ncbi:monosaccharide-transporting ATPase [Brachyspira pilosicoli WesB]|uniref:Monosaccharide-transporting ATPase n=1 Tax=Brachyspira pilosicoli WesB TaxID=1161918 RepID=K0JMN4_BRAPL|nr:sugar ABC transporter ATP-binding protein [Brachyspira pilosicoli]CCG57651.1 monosaccharide-transporting ATPase [Brachyspira pilosicoli WesB]
MEQLLLMKNISKTFGFTKALDNVNLSLCSGECLALMGENGAGKSTLIKILMGAYTKDSGEIFIDGKNINIQSPNDAKKNGISAVYQDVFLAKELSIGENFFLGNLPKNKLGQINWNKVYEESANHLKKLNIELNPKEKLSKLTIAGQQMVAIAKSIYQNAKIIIFDEPTALLTNDEKIQIFNIIEHLKKSGHGIIYVSHRMEEIFQISDRVTVLKDGKYIDTVNTKETDENQLVKLMVGRSFEDMYNIDSNASDEVVLEIKDLCSSDNKIKNISFSLNKSEILGMFGLIGAGRTETMRMIFGADKFKSGFIKLNGQDITFRNPKEAIKHNMGYIAEDRKNQSLALNLSIKDNVNLPSYNKISRFGVINSKKMVSNTNEYVDKLHIKISSINQSVNDLSGGNQQKVVIAKWLLTGSKIIVADEPTIGVDVGARAEIYKLFESLTKSGVSIILISSYLPEIMGLSDRIMVMHEGVNMGILEKKDFSEEKIMALASGLK